MNKMKMCNNEIICNNNMKMKIIIIMYVINNNKWKWKMIWNMKMK